MSFAPYLTCHNLAIRYGVTQLFENLCFAVHPGERWGIVGPNGAGKSTLFRLLTGVTEPDSGTVAMRNGIRCVVVTQKFDVDENSTVEEALKKALPPEYDLDSQRDFLEKEMDAHAALTENNHDLVHDVMWERKLTSLQDSLSNLSGAGTQNILDSALRVANMTDMANRPVSSLSGGQQKRLQIISALLQNPQLILLDEPTNHLDVQTVDWLEEFLLGIVEQGIGLLGIRAKDSTPEPFSFVIISHDRALLDTLVTNILEIEGGQARPFVGNYEAYAQQKLEIEISEQKSKDRMANLYRRELAWLRRGAQARSTKQTARIHRAEALGKDLKTKEQKIQTPKKTDMEFEAQLQDEERNSDDNFVPVLRSLGEQQLVVLKKCTVVHPNQDTKSKLLFRDMDLAIKPRMRLALLGPNGCGKSTLLNILAGHTKPTSGEVIFHELTKISYFDQQREELDKTLTVRQTVSPDGEFVFFGGRHLHVMSYLERFLFWREDAMRTVSELSGGEQARILLAKLMLEHGNLLILDEPTNDLDINTLQTLERNLADFQGGIIFTSHDRYFLQRVATHILAYLGDKREGNILVGQWMMFPDLNQALENIDKFKSDKHMPQKVTPAQSAPENGTAAPARNEGARKKKASFQEVREFETLEKRIAALEKMIPSLTQELEAAYAESKPFAEIARLQGELAARQNEMNVSYVRWEELFEKMDA
jgi:ATP-binding cassette subfamily F protein uup